LANQRATESTGIPSFLSVFARSASALTQLREKKAFSVVFEEEFCGRSWERLHVFPVFAM
jgi:hypothetical protein